MSVHSLSGSTSRALDMIEMIGVMPLPAATAT
jgi:hypothetical protein